MTGDQRKLQLNLEDWRPARTSTKHLELETSTKVHTALGTGDQQEGLQSLEDWQPPRTSTNLEDWRP